RRSSSRPTAKTSRSFPTAAETEDQAAMAGIDDKERRIGPDARRIDRSSVPDAGTMTGGAKTPSRYWTPETKPHRVIFPQTLGPNYRFDFRSTAANSRRGTVHGQDFTSGHDGTYEIRRSDANMFQMYVRIGVPENPTKDMDATISISGTEATLSGKLKGQPANPAKCPVTGDGTPSAPFHVDFPDQPLEWYLQ